MQTTYKILQYDRIDISEGNDVNKTSLLKECDICHYWYFKDIGFRYEPYLCNGCHDLMQKSMSFNNVAIVYVKGNAYRIHFWYMSKDDEINIMNGSNLILLYIRNEWMQLRWTKLHWFNLLLKKQMWY